MPRIFQANMFRLRKSRMFWLSVILTAPVTAAFVLIDCLSVSGGASECALEKSALSGAPLVQIVITAVIILFLGTDHSQKTMRNKVIVGNQRVGIYSADVLTGIVIGCSINAAWLIGGLAGVPILGLWKMKSTEAALYILMTFAGTVSLSSVIALIAVLIQRRSWAAVTALVMTFALIIAAGTVYARLGENKEVMSGVYINGELTFEIAENPDYIGGLKRLAYELALHVDPLGSSIALSNCDLKDPAADIAGAAFVIVFVSSLGAAAFRHKELL